MRILHVIANLALRYGGPAKAALEMAEALANLGHEVTIFTTNQDGPDRLDVPLHEPVRQNGVSIRYFPVQSPAFWSTSLPLGRALKEEIPNYDLVHIHGMYLFHTLLAGHYCRAYKVPYLICPHGTLDPFIYKRHRSRKKLLEVLYENRNIKHAAALHYITEEEMTLARPFISNPRGMVVPIGLDADAYSHLPAAGSFKEQYPQLAGKKMVLFFSRLNYKKGLDILVKAFSLAQERHPDAMLVITGPDNENYGEQVRKWVEEAGLTDKVIFTGMLIGETKIAVLRDADLFVLPSYSENFGIAVIEASICGTPVLISDKVNIWREIMANDAGRVAPCNSELFAEQMCELLADTSLCESMGRNGIKMVHQYYMWDQIGLSLEREYGNIIGWKGGDRPVQKNTALQYEPRT